MQTEREIFFFCDKGMFKIIHGHGENLFYISAHKNCTFFSIQCIPLLYSVKEDPPKLDLIDCIFYIHLVVVFPGF